MYFMTAVTFYLEKILEIVGSGNKIGDVLKVGFDG